MRFFSISDRGKQRANNEDCCVAKQIGKYTALILADGMGGHLGGEIASSKAIEAVLSHLEENLSDKLYPSQIFSFLSSALKKANESILSLSGEDSSLKGMGTTIDICLILDDAAFIAHIGDGRIYKISSSGKLDRLTKDHSLMEYMIEKGALTPEEALKHPQRNVITRALGTSADTEEDTLTLKLKKSDRLLLCSDGLTNMLSEDVILKTVFESKNPEDAASMLIKCANDAGGADNITVILAQY